MVFVRVSCADGWDGGCGAPWCVLWCVLWCVCHVWVCICVVWVGGWVSGSMVCGGVGDSVCAVCVCVFALCAGESLVDVCVGLHSLWVWVWMWVWVWVWVWVGVWVWVWVWVRVRVRVRVWVWVWGSTLRVCAWESAACVYVCVCVYV